MNAADISYLGSDYTRAHGVTVRSSLCLWWLSLFVHYLLRGQDIREEVNLSRQVNQYLHQQVMRDSSSFNSRCTLAAEPKLVASTSSLACRLGSSSSHGFSSAQSPLTCACKVNGPCINGWNWYPDSSELNIYVLSSIKSKQHILSRHNMHAWTTSTARWSCDKTRACRKWHTLCRFINRDIKSWQVQRSPSKPLAWKCLL